MHSVTLPPVPCSVWRINQHFGSGVIGGAIGKASWETGVQTDKYFTPIAQRQSQHQTHTRFEGGEGVTERFMVPQGRIPQTRILQVRIPQGTGPEFAG